MLPIRWNLTSAQPYDGVFVSGFLAFDLLTFHVLVAHLSVGAQADSAHEYLLKQYLLTSKTDKANLEMCTFKVIFLTPAFIFMNTYRYPYNDPYHRRPSLHIPNPASPLRDGY